MQLLLPGCVFYQLTFASQPTQGAHQPAGALGHSPQYTHATSAVGLQFTTITLANLPLVEKSRLLICS